jgi:hypothetical protein
MLKRYVLDFNPGPAFDMQGMFDESGDSGFLMKIPADGYW